MAASASEIPYVRHPIEFPFVTAILPAALRWLWRR
jgi:hypothetical protein